MIPGANHPQELHEVRGVLTRFMRMLFPLEFRIDSLGESRPMLPFRYPLSAGEMIYLPERLSGVDAPGAAYDYYLLTGAHLAARHEFGTFALELGALSGFEGRTESGAEALEAFVGSFADPELADALLRLCEAARLDAELGRRYPGLAPRLVALNWSLAQELEPGAMSTALVRAAFGVARSCDGGADADAAGYLLALREPGATVVDSALSAAALYQWVQELVVRQAREGDPEALRRSALGLRKDLAGGPRPRGSEEMMPGSGEEGGDGDCSRPERPGSAKRGGAGRALSAVELRRMLEQGARMRRAGPDAGTDGEQPHLARPAGGRSHVLRQLREQLGTLDAGGARVSAFGRRGQRGGAYFAYDEWDYLARDYRRNWCRLREIELRGDGGDFYARTLSRYGALLPLVRRHFQRIRPASYRMVRGLEDGDEIDLDRTVEARVALLRGEIPRPDLYKARRKEARDVATLFLLDMSASTDEPIPGEARRAAAAGSVDDWMRAWQTRERPHERPRRIIDVNKEALVVMAQALEELGDAYAIMGFSGHGRDNVEFYVIKEFGDELSGEVKARIGAVEPKRSTRMGTAIRHVREKFKDVSARARHAIMLSDGFPQDFDYGNDRRSNLYGIQDTMMALKELEMAGVAPFCITVDRTGHDYLRQICAASRYLVIEDIASLPRELPKIYEQLVRW